jgi:hypothetical protein
MSDNASVNGSEHTGYTDARRAQDPPGLLRTLVAVVFGFFTFAATLAVVVVLTALTFGPEFAYEGDTWRTTPGLQVVVLLAGGVGAFMGGAVCRPAGGSARTVPIFAFSLLLTVVVWLTMRSSAADPNAARAVGIADMSSGHNAAILGPLVLFGLPVVAFVMAYLGGTAADRVQRGLFGR